MQEKYRAEGIPESPHYIDADPTTNAMGLAYFEVNKAEIMDRLRKHGAVLFRCRKSSLLYLSLPSYLLHLQGLRRDKNARGVPRCLAGNGPEPVLGSDPQFWSSLYALEEVSAIDVKADAIRSLRRIFFLLQGCRV